MNKWIATLLLMSFPLFADDAKEEIKDYDSDICVSRHHESCVNTVCLTSESTSCPEDCRKMAMDKCGVKSTIESEDGENG